MNDTIVVFDRIRENRRADSGGPIAKTINLSVNQTLSRTVLTSGLTLLTAISLFVLGGQVLRGFSLALVIGIIAGTFSSIFIASPILLAWEEWRLGRSLTHGVASKGSVR
jgi:preprotein translocase subunit SecF